MNLTKYTVVTSDDFGKFEDRVNQLLGDGWELQGGVSTAALPDSQGNVLHVQWSQALILPAGASALEAVEEMALPLPGDFESITPALARQSGFASVPGLLRVAVHGAGRNVYLIDFHFEGTSTKRKAVAKSPTTKKPTKKNKSSQTRKARGLRRAK